MEDSAIPPPPAEAVAGVRTLFDALNLHFAPLVLKFEELYSAWRETWDAYQMALNSNCGEGEGAAQFNALTDMGPLIIPLIVQKLTFPSDIFAVHLYSFLEKDPELRVMPEKILPSDGFHLHANLIVQLNHKRNKRFDTQVVAWKQHREENRFSSNSSSYVSGDAYESLVEMGTSVIPNIMVVYATEQGGWWHELLHEIAFGRRAGTRTFFKPKLYASWKAWFNSGEPLNAAARGL